jgi:hypothetical protein
LVLRPEGSCDVEIGHASGVLGREGWRLLLLLLLEAIKKLFHQGIGFSASFASCGDLLVGWHDIDWFSLGYVLLDRSIHRIDGSCVFFVAGGGCRRWLQEVVAGGEEREKRE